MLAITFTLGCLAFAAFAQRHQPIAIEPKEIGLLGSLKPMASVGEMGRHMCYSDRNKPELTEEIFAPISEMHERSLKLAQEFRTVAETRLSCIPKERLNEAIDLSFKLAFLYRRLPEEFNLSEDKTFEFLAFSISSARSFVAATDKHPQINEVKMLEFLALNKFIPLYKRRKDLNNPKTKKEARQLEQDMVSIAANFSLKNSPISTELEELLPAYYALAGQTLFKAVVSRKKAPAHTVRSYLVKAENFFDRCLEIVVPSLDFPEQMITNCKNGKKNCNKLSEKIHRSTEKIASNEHSYVTGSRFL